MIRIILKSLLSVSAICVFAIRLAPVIMFAMAGFLASAEANAAPGVPEVHGKVTVKLTKKFSVYVPGATSLAWSPDGTTLAVANGEQLKLFDNQGKLHGGFENHGFVVPTLQLLGFINGASQLLFPVESEFNDDHALDIREVPGGQIVNYLKHKRDSAYNSIGTTALAISPDQKRAAVASNILFGFLVFATDDGKEWHELSHEILNDHDVHHFGATSVCFFPDGKLLAVGGGEGHFYVADSATGQVVKQFRVYDAPGIKDNIDGLAVSPKGDLILTGLHEIGIAPQQATSKSLAWNANGHPMVDIWRVSDGKEIAGFHDPGKNIRHAIWDPQDRFVAFVDTDSLVLWQPMTAGENYIRVKFATLAISLAITRDGKSLAVSSGDYATVYNVE